MQEVQFLNDEGGGQREMGRVTFNGEVVDFHGVNPILKEELYEDGIIIGSKTFYPKDGLSFLTGLKYAFSGSRFRATGVREI